MKSLFAPANQHRTPRKRVESLPDLADDFITLRRPVSAGMSSARESDRTSELAALSPMIGKHDSAAHVALGSGDVFATSRAADVGRG